MRSLASSALLASLATLGVLVAGCLGDPGSGDDDDSVDLPDAAPGQPDADPANCDPLELLPSGYKPIDKVSAGAVSTTGSGTLTTLVDATAGGFGASSTEPFVYVSFTGGTAAKVAIGDPASFDSSEWDLAFKRYVIRANGGDSGTGGVEVAAVSAASLDQVSAPPGSGFAADDWSSAACALVSGDQLGAPATAVGTWYVTNNMVLSPQPLVYVVKLRDGSHIKLRVDSYYGDPGDPTRSAYFRLQWAPL